MCWFVVCVYGSIQIEKDGFGWLGGGDGQLTRLLGARTIARLQLDAVEPQRPFGDLQPRTPTGLQFVRDGLASFQPDAIDVRVLMNRR